MVDDKHDENPFDVRVLFELVGLNLVHTMSMA